MDHIQTNYLYIFTAEKSISVCKVTWSCVAGGSSEYQPLMTVAAPPWLDQS